MAVENPKIESSTALAFDNVQVDNSAKIGVSDTAVTNIIGTMGALVSGISESQLNTIQKLSSNQTIASSGFSVEKYKYWILAVAGILLVFIIKKSMKKR